MAQLVLGYADEGPNRHERDVVAMHHLTRGNEFAMSGEHRAAIVEWEQAAKHRPDSNVPWNNMANSFTALGDSTEARRAAEEACKRGVDHLSSTTTANIYRSLKLWEEAEAVLLAGIDATIRSFLRLHPLKLQILFLQARAAPTPAWMVPDTPANGRSGLSYHHPFWSLAMLYWDQGDYLGFLEYAKMGIDYKADPDCGLHGASRATQKCEGAVSCLGTHINRFGCLT